MPICKALYNQVCVEIGGVYKPCCSYVGDSGISVNDMTPNEFLKSDYIENIRKNMEGDLWDSGCVGCKVRSESGLHTLKDTYDFYCKSDIGTFEMIEISVSNKCNNQCRMCDSRHSSLWQNTLGFGNSPKSYYDLQALMNNLDGSDIKVIKYLGGEPLITDEINQVFDFIKKNKENKISFYFNTNLSVPPEKYLSEFENIEKFVIGYSIDGVGATNEYIRDGSNWDTVVRNLDKWEKFFESRSDQSERYVHTVLQAYNYHDIENIYKFSSSYGLEHFTPPIIAPHEFTLNALPKEYIEKYATSRTAKYVDNHSYNASLYDKLVKTTIYHDKLFQKSINNFIPELYFLSKSNNDTP
jgi:organic radical activating enzyme